MADVQSPPAQTALATPDTSLEQPTTELAPISTEQTIVTTNAEGKKVKKIIRRKRRPARPQVDPATFKTDAPPPTGTIFNIWYNKWSGGDREDKYLSKTAAQGRCNVAKDSGYTKADRTPGSYFCLFFARGICPKGVDCEYLHRLPAVTDMFPSNIDCFGYVHSLLCAHRLFSTNSYFQPRQALRLPRRHGRRRLFPTTEPHTLRRTNTRDRRH